MRNSVAVVARGDEVFIGVPRKAKSEDGRSVVDIAELHEYGGPPVVIPITPKMRRFLAVLAKQQGIIPNGTGSGVVVVQVPARPWLRPAFEEWRKGAQNRFLERVAWEMGFGMRPPGVRGQPLAGGASGGSGGTKRKSKPSRKKSVKHVAAAKLGWARRRAKKGSL
jgi:hypothetical protein